MQPEGRLVKCLVWGQWTEITLVCWRTRHAEKIACVLETFRYPRRILTLIVARHTFSPS
jgi:hypothetical protein